MAMQGLIDTVRFAAGSESDGGSAGRSESGGGGGGSAGRSESVGSGGSADRASESQSSSSGARSSGGGDDQAWLRSRDSDFSFRCGRMTIHDLGVVSFKANEAMSELFSVRLDLASEDRDLAIEEIVGRPGVLRILHPDSDLDRYFNGIVSRFEFVGEGVRFARYECELVPFIWLLGLRHKCRIFQDMSVPDIVKKVFEDADVPSDTYRFALTKEYKPREYCVQYRETELNFIRRLLEEEGIFFFFEHTELKHVMVIGDAPSAHVPIPGDFEVIFRGPSEMVQAEEFVSHFRYGQQVRPGAAMLRDFEFKQPKLNLQVAEEFEIDTSLEIYDYPGEYKEQDVGTNLVEVRLQELQANRKTSQARSVCRRMRPGFRYKLKEHIREDLNQEYLITSVTHRGTQPTTLEDEPSATVLEGPLYENIVEAIPQVVPFRPPRVTPRPKVYGTQTAIVVGPSGEEIYTDKHGRVKVHFHWDREGVFDEKASCWIRVSQNWAGGKYGSIFLPRIAHEVVVDFLEGNPDDPIIVGRVYNGDEQTPYTLPDEKTKSTVRTANSKGQDGAHEIRFEDKKGEEQIFIHSEKDLHMRVKNTRTVNIQADSHETIGGEHRLNIKKNCSRKIEKQEAIDVAEDRSIVVGGDVLEDFKANHKEKTASNYYLEASQVVIKAATGISLVCGGSHVTVTPAGVDIDGPMVNINCGKSPKTDSAGSPAAPAEPGSADTETPGQDTSYTGETREQKKIPHEELPAQAWINISLQDEEGNPIPGEPYRITTDDGREFEGTLDVNGEANIRGLNPGECQIRFPRRDENEINRG